MTIFNINIEPLNILPDFVGYFIICLGLVKIQKEYLSKSFKIAITLTNVLIFYSIVISIVKFTGVGDVIEINNGNYPYKRIIEIGLGLLESPINLLMIFYIFSGTIDMFIGFKLDTHANNIINYQKNYIILYIIGLILLSISINISSEKYYFATVFYILIINLNFATLISGIRKIVNKDIIKI